MSYFENRARNFEVDEKKVIAPYPTNALIEVTNACNHKCLFCYNPIMQRKISKLDKSVYHDFLLCAVGAGLLEVGLYTTGEPFCSRDLHEYIEIAKSLGVKRVYVTTNGALADKEYVEKCIKCGLDSIKFSINASDRESYQKIHGKDDWDKVLKNIKDIYALKNSYPGLQLLGSCIMTTVTGDIIEEHKKIFSKYLEDIWYAYAKSQGGRNSEYIEKISFPVEKISISAIKPCEMLWNRWHLTCEGYLTCCCIDYELDLVYADIRIQDPLTAWNGQLMQEMRKKHLMKNLEGTICYNCLTGANQSYAPILELAETKNDKIDSSKLDAYRERLLSACAKK